MTKRMLIDATHAEETRVVVLDDTKLEDFDVETASKRQLKGNIYLAKIVRVEPSLQAAFVEYGGGRHGFLAFGEIHPDYYQIPVADRQRLLAIQAEEARAAEAEEDAAALRHEHHAASPASSPATDEVPAEPDHSAEPDPDGDLPEFLSDAETPRPQSDVPVAEIEAEHEPAVAAPSLRMAQDLVTGNPGTAPEPDAPSDDPAEAESVTETGEEPAEIAFEGAGAAEPPVEPAVEPAETETGEAEPPPPPPETLGGDDATSEVAEDARARRTSRLLRSYRIQEVIHRRQILLVQVVKEERGTKGAALTTYISLAGRFCVLMPNSPRGGGISRKITSAADRKRLKEVTAELDLPTGMGLIVRTAGANRPKPEIRRDCEYLMRLWDDIREHTLRSIAPALIYEEASLIKRAIRDVYSRDIDDILVDGETGFRAAHDFMRMLMPSHARKVQLWRGADGGGQAGQPLFARYQVEAQLEAMLNPTVQLRSGGYLVIDQTEALVAIDVNSGRSTRERNVEETALRTNLEAADEVARQLRLRDLAGLIVVDFIDMESRRHNAAVEKRLKDALRVDRARIQLGQISHFGLLEMSRQRLRPSLAETSFDPCPHCGGTGQVRNIESSAVGVLRAIEDEGAKGRASVIQVHCGTAVMMCVLNHKRERLGEIEVRFGMRVQFAPDETIPPGQARIERLRAAGEVPPPRALQAPVVPAAPALPAPEIGEDEFEDDDEPETDAGAAAGAAERSTGATEDSERRRKRRRRRRGGRRENGGIEAGEGPEEPEPERHATFDPVADAAEMPADSTAGPELAPAADTSEQPEVDLAALDEDGLPKARRRGRRGGRRRRREDEPATEAPAAPEQPAAPPPYRGPTPADPYGSGVFDIFDIIDTAGNFPSAPPGAPALPATLMDPERESAAPELQTDALVVRESDRVEVETEPTVAEAAPTPSREPLVPDIEPAEPQIGPRIQPVLIGTGEAAPEPRRGWWRR